MSRLTAEEAGSRAAALVASTLRADHREKLQLSTILPHAGIEVMGENVPMAPPLHTSTTYTRPVDGIYKEG
jgi:hypothetical protein